MKIIFAVLAFAGCALQAAGQARPDYPAPPRGNTIDTFFGTSVPDPFRLLESDTPISTRTWLQEQAALTNRQLAPIVRHYALEPQLRYNSYADFPAGTRQGSWYFHLARTPNEPEPSLYRHRRLREHGEKVASPEWYRQGRNDRPQITNYALSPNEQFLALGISHQGSDWKEIHIRDLRKNRSLDEVIKDVKFSDIVWRDSGFYYMRYRYAGTNRLKDQTEQAELCYHQIGAASDSVLYTNKSDLKAFIRFSGIPTQDYLIIYDSYHAGNRLRHQIYTLALKGPESGQLRTLLQVPGKGEFNILGLYHGKFLLHTTLNAPHGKLLLLHPQDGNDVTEIIPEHAEVLKEACITGDQITCVYLKDIDYFAVTYDSSGVTTGTISYPSGTSVGHFTTFPGDSVAYFQCTSFLHPPIIYTLHPRSLTVTMVDETKVAYDPTLFTTEKVFYTSKDGTSIPMILAYRKGMKRNSNNPTLLYGYGGYGTIMTPFYDRNFMSHVQNGGIVALPCIRGGGEFGDEWHREGIQHRKQQSFDDFIAAAEFLAREKYTRAEKLAIMGGSNGGLLVAAVVNQRPDLCKVAVAERGLYDMLRYQHFTIGHAWEWEYGLSTDSNSFRQLYNYSPLHNVRSGIAYPAMLITTADHDDRVVPLHSYKYTAALQAATSATLPIMLLVTGSAGHSTKDIKEDEKIYAFIYHYLNVPAGQTGILLVPGNQ